jgi:hypothetical protein
VGVLCGWIADMAIGKYGIRVSTVRKVAQSIGMVGCAIFMMIGVYTGKTAMEGAVSDQCPMQSPGPHTLGSCTSR